MFRSNIASGNKLTQIKCATISKLRFGKFRGVLQMGKDNNRTKFYEICLAKCPKKDWNPNLYDVVLGFWIPKNLSPPGTDLQSTKQFIKSSYTTVQRSKCHPSLHVQKILLLFNVSAFKDSIRFDKNWSLHKVMHHNHNYLTKSKTSNKELIMKLISLFTLMTSQRKE